MKRKLQVMRCDLVDCRGDINGCNSSECRNAKWDKMTEEEYEEYFCKKPETFSYPKRRQIKDLGNTH